MRAEQQLEAAGRLAHRNFTISNAHSREDFEPDASGKMNARTAQTSQNFFNSNMIFVNEGNDEDKFANDPAYRHQQEQDKEIVREYVNSKMHH